MPACRRRAAGDVIDGGQASAWFGVSEAGGIEVVDRRVLSAGATQPVPLPSPDSGQIETRRFIKAPGGIGMIPARSIRFMHPHELELHHESLVAGEILHLAMPDIVVDQQEPAGLQAARDFRHQRLVRTLRLVLAAGDHAGGTALEGSGLWHIHHHRPAATVVAYPAQVAPVAILVDTLRVGAGRVVVQGTTARAC
jgi:hypothetical protein